MLGDTWMMRNCVQVLLGSLSLFPSTVVGCFFLANDAIGRILPVGSNCPSYYIYGTGAWL